MTITVRFGSGVGRSRTYVIIRLGVPLARRHEAEHDIRSIKLVLASDTKQTKMPAR